MGWMVLPTENADVFVQTQHIVYVKPRVVLVAGTDQTRRFAEVGLVTGGTFMSPDGVLDVDVFDVIREAELSSEGPARIGGSL